MSNGNLANLGGVSADNIPPLGSLVAAAPDGKVPTIYNFSIGVQRDIGWGTTVDVAYVGSLSRHLVTSRNGNQIPYLTAFSRDAQDPSKYPGGVVPDVEPDLPQAYADAGFNYSGNYAFDAPFLVPYRGYAHDPVLQVRRQCGLPLAAGVAAAAVQQGSDFRRWRTPIPALARRRMPTRMQQDAFDTRRYDYRLAWWDRPHVLVFNYVYDLPNLGERVRRPEVAAVYSPTTTSCRASRRSRAAHPSTPACGGRRP